jgi:hypothetical protein
VIWAGESKLSRCRVALARNRISMWPPSDDPGAPSRHDWCPGRLAAGAACSCVVPNLLLFIPHLTPPTLMLTLVGGSGLGVRLSSKRALTPLFLPSLLRMAGVHYSKLLMLRVRHTLAEALETVTNYPRPSLAHIFTLMPLFPVRAQTSSANAMYRGALSHIKTID